MSELEEGIELPTSESHSLVVLGLTVEVFLHDLFRTPLPGARYELTCQGQTFAGEANGDGMAKVLVNEKAKTCILRWRRDSREEEFEYEREIFLDIPSADTPDGQHRRLHNLGLPAQDDMALALSLFQGIWDLEDTGEADSATVGTLGTAAHDAIALSESDGAAESADDTERT
jgi:hypothetical protein